MIDSKKIAKDIAHYSSLFGIVLAGLLGFFLFSYDKVFQMSIAIGVAGAYVTWGIVHHFLHRDLSVGVVLEYLAIAFLGIVIIYSVLLRS